MGDHSEVPIRKDFRSARSNRLRNVTLEQCPFAPVVVLIWGALDQEGGYLRCRATCSRGHAVPRGTVRIARAHQFDSVVPFKRPVWLFKRTHGAQLGFCVAERSGELFGEGATDGHTPQEAWDDLAEGNLRFMTDTLLHPQQNAARRNELSRSQAPNAAFLGCSDSRVAAEILFDCGLGDLFVVRNIGQIANTNTTATMEFAVAELGVAVIVVLAHCSCGAVAAAINQSSREPAETSPAIKRELEQIQPSVQQEWLSEHRETPYVDPDRIDADAVGRRHLAMTINDLMRNSPIISDAVAAGELGIVGCQYQLEEGRVAPITAVGKLDIKHTGV